MLLYNCRMLAITSSIRIDERDLHFDFIRAAGPGGQNVNKAATAVQLRFDARGSSLPEDVKSRLVKLAGRRMTQEGVLVIEARKFRTQEQNREDALARFITLMRKAAVRPKARRNTRPTKASKEERLKIKKQRSEVKRGRQMKVLD